MGNTLCTSPKDSELRSALRKFDKQEQNMLKKLFTNLAARSDGNTMNKETFLQFIQMPGMWGERLFSEFDIKENNCIDYTEFMVGLGKCVRGTEEEKYRVLFKLHDLTGDDYINKNELIMMLHNIPSTVMFLDSPTLIHSDSSPNSPYSKRTSSKKNFEITLQSAVGKEDENKVDSKASTEFKEDLKVARLDSNSPTSKSPTNSRAAFHESMKELMSPLRIEGMVDKIIDDHDVEMNGKLSFDEFRSWLIDNPIVLECFSEVFQEEYWASKLNIHRKGSATQQQTQSQLSEINDPAAALKQQHKHVIYEKAMRSYNAEDEHTKMKGFLFKRGKKTRRWLKRWHILKGNILYYFYNQQDQKPAGVLFLEGFYVIKDNKFNSESKFGFKITHEYDKYESHLLYCNSEQERDTWYQLLIEESKSYNIKERYEIGEQIGIGKFAVVHEAVDKHTDEKFAVKIINKARLCAQEKELLRSEISIMKVVHHPHVVSIRDVFDEKDKLYIVMELVQGGELFEAVIKRKFFPEDESREIIRQLLQTLAYLHQCGIIHRDLKPENILLQETDGNITAKIADFGLSKLIGPKESLNVPCGTLSYVAPEMIEMNYSFSADIWSMGCILYLLLRGKLPIEAKDKSQLIRKTLECKIIVDDPHWVTVSEGAKDVVKGLLEKDPVKRLTIEQALKHPWMLIGAPDSDDDNFVGTQKKDISDFGKEEVKKTLTNHYDADDDESDGEEPGRERKETDNPHNTIMETHPSRV
eukprot:CAMPEP_0115019946 /NCGR_PEP_ID=MMETSP0216-20121206/29784_1 /TAXON_ID=223996 /ORGANISM="Protocruzia adherens, Strain Boccale" /LENGTH=753 /DNA_ID=CAMNT_0002391589 /DNA_START=207 /DNA_END=2468 /DNA_ORIENTATION=+